MNQWLVRSGLGERALVSAGLARGERLSVTTPERMSVGLLTTSKDVESETELNKWVDTLDRVTQAAWAEVAS
jgi:hypothetical protein